MARFVVCELYELKAQSAEAARAKVLAAGGRRKRVVIVADSLDRLAHPVHLAEAQQMFGEDTGG